MRRLALIRMAAGVGALTLLGGLQAAAAPVSSVQVPPGAHYEVKGSIVSLQRQNGAGGSYSCSCAASKGSCAIKQSPGVLQCASSTADPCSNCEMETTTNPKHFDAARAAGAGGSVSHSNAP